jgi:hypothetical protein
MLSKFQQQKLLSKIHDENRQTASTASILGNAHVPHGGQTGPHAESRERPIRTAKTVTRQMDDGHVIGETRSFLLQW